MSQPSGAESSPSISFLRAALPGFEPTFQGVLREELGELDALHAAAEFGRWFVEVTSVDPASWSARRASEAIEALAVDEQSADAREIAQEAIDAIAEAPAARVLLGVHAQALVRYHGP